MAELAVKAGVLICGPCLRDSRWRALKFCRKPKRSDLIAFTVGSANLFKPGVHAVLGWSSVTILPYNPRDTQTCIGPKFLRVPGSLNLLAESKLLLTHCKSSMHVMNEKEGPGERMESINDHSSKSRESSSNSGNEQLLADAYQLVLDHACRHYMGNRLSPQSAYDIRHHLALLLSQYEIRQIP